MGKAKKHKNDESSQSEESTESSSSSSSSSSETTSEESTSSNEDKSYKKRKIKTVKTAETKIPKRENESSTNSSSSNSDDEHNESSDDNKNSTQKKTHKKHPKDIKDLNKNKKIRSDGDEVRTEEKVNRVDNTEHVKKETTSLHNRSKWDSPSNDLDDNKRERPRERNWYREHNDNSNYKRDRRHENNRGVRFSNRRNVYRERPDYDGEKRRGGDRNREYEHDRNRDRDRDQKYRSRDNNYNDKRNTTWENRNRRDNRENKNQKINRENRNQRDDRESRNERDDRENRRSRSPRRPRHFPRKRSEDDDKAYEWGKKEERDENTEKLSEDKEKPNFALSGKLTEDANKVNGIVIKYAEPLESRKPKRRWRLYPFKGEKALATLYIHRQSCYLIGRDRKICDLPVDHPSCSKQHAALQYRLVPFEREDGSLGKRVRPYLIDLESANGTFINNKKTESKKYIELLEKDVIKFGFSSREYVLLHENSKEDQLDDDITEEVQVKTEPTDD